MDIKAGTRILALITQILIMIFMLKGMLSEYGYVSKFTETQIYQFSYLGFSVAGFLFMQWIIDTNHDKKTD